MRFFHLFLLLTLTPALPALGAEQPRTFNVPAGDAIETLRQFAKQAEREVVYLPDDVRGHQTNRVAGEFTVPRALELLLARTALRAKTDRESGAIGVGVESATGNPVSGRAAPETAPQRPDDRDAGDDFVALSPFVVSDESDSGWVANETLGGSRLRTEFRDIPNQIETLTREFMQDFGLSTLDDALIYTANVENNSEFISQNPGDQVTFPNQSGRVRGLALGTLTRNFFKTQTPTDNYNVDRATIASGPNAILFGLGSPAGVIDATPARAKPRNHYSFEARFDTQNSNYGRFDANFAIWPRKLMVRIMGMSKDSHTDKKPNFDRNDRLYGTLTFRPFERTTLVLQGERSSREWNAASRLAPVDFVTPWLNADKIAGTGYTTPRPVFDNSSLAGIGSNRLFAQAADSPVIIQGGAIDVRNWRNSATVRSPASMPGVEPTFDAGAVFTLLDDAVFPLDVNVMGTSRLNQMDSRIRTAILEQRITDSLSLELAYNHENSSNLLLASGGQVNGNNYPLLVDPNKYIPGTTTPNPYFGQLYFQGATADRLQYFTNEAWRATLSYDLNPARIFQSQAPWIRRVGRHRFAAMYTGTKDELLDQSGFVRRILDDPVIPGLNLRSKTLQNWAGHPTRVPQVRHYFTNPYEPTEPAGPFFGDWTFVDANGASYTYYKFDTPLRSADGRRLSAQNPAGGSLNRADAVMLAWQGFFLPDRRGRDRLVITYGYRKDTARTAVLDAPSIKQDFSGLYPGLWHVDFAPYGPQQSGTNRNVGIVARPLHWLSFSYNQSTTFDLNVGRFDPFGRPLPGTGGDGEDIGIRFDLLQDRLSLKINRYDTVLGPQRASNQINAFASQIAFVENRVLELDPSLPRINVTDGTQTGFPIRGTGAYNITSNAASKGYEVELNFTPSPQWNFRLNGAKSESVESNIGREWFDWIDQRLPVWQSVVAKNGEVDASGQPVTWTTALYSATTPTGQTLSDYYQNTTVGQALAFISAVDGRANPFARGYRFNAIVNYRFTEGLLRGFNIGGAFRWRAAPVVGYGVQTGPGGTTILDLDRVYKGEPERFVDLNLGYRRHIRALGGVTYRLQLNVRNLFNDREPVPAGALTTGAVYRIATLEPRLIAATLGVDF